MLGVMTMIMVVGTFIAFNRVEAPTQTKHTSESSTTSPMALTLTSPAFKDGGLMPSLFTCDGKNINPGLQFQGVPQGTKSLVLVMDDPDIPDSVKQARGIEKFDHWVLYNIPPETTGIPEGIAIGTRGANSTGSTTYIGPCPPDREHRYIFRLYALSGLINFTKSPTLEEVESVAKGMEIARATLIGRYERNK